MFTEAEVFSERLSTVEKLKIRGASEDGLLHLFYSMYRFEFALDEAAALKQFLKAVQLVDTNFYRGVSETAF